jgi:hypothetical protein
MMTTLQSPCRVILPIRLGLDLMKRLFIANFNGDPEFEAIEPQLFDDAINGKGLRIFRYRKDCKVDVYWQKGVHVDKSTCILGAGIGDFEEVTIEPEHFEITERGVEIDLAFTDFQGRENRLRVLGDAARKYGFPMLAPVGAGIEKPRQFFLAYMPDIRLIHRAGTIIEARIGDRKLRPASLPILMHGRRVLFIRCAARPVIATLNPPMNRPLVIDLAVPGIVEAEGTSLTVDRSGGVAQIAAARESKDVIVNFVPSFPNLLGLPNGGSAIGKWSIWITDVLITGGTYSVKRTDHTVTTELDVTDNWKPSGLPLSMKLFNFIMRSFRTWPSTYRWRGTVQIDAIPTMFGTWERKGQ